ncbi:MAG: type II toxin-antitoxin system Phd/YefM family antitoxin [Thermodesulfobacteriota bacterium]
MQLKNYLSATQLSKNTAATLNSLETGETDKLIILKNNSPKAILMSVASYEAMEEETEDLRLTSLALSRIQNFNFEETIPHKEMMNKYTK